MSSKSLSRIFLITKTSYIAISKMGLYQLGEEVPHVVVLGLSWTKTVLYFLKRVLQILKHTIYPKNLKKKH